MSSSLRACLGKLIPEETGKREEILRAHGDDPIANVTARQMSEGLAGAKVLLSMLPRGASRVDNVKGLIIAGDPILSIARQPFEEIVFRLLTSRPPTEAELRDLREDLQRRRMAFWQGPQWERFLQLVEANVYVRSDPMDSLSAIIKGLSYDTRMGRALGEYAPEEITWEDRLDDMLDLLVVASISAAAIYRRLYADGKLIAPQKEDSFALALARSLGAFKSEAHLILQKTVIDLLLVCMSYHGIGNVSTNAAVTAASANSSVFSVYGALLAGLIGPNHGGAASFGVHYLFSLAKAAGFDASDDVLARIAGGRIDKKSPIWCVGHRILRGEDGDPRATAVINLLEECFSDNRLFRLAQRWYPLAIEQLKSKKPEVAFQAVNIDSYSGVALHAAGIIADYRMAAFAGLIFAVSRIAGAGAEIFWHAAAGKPKLIRPSASNWDELEARTGGVSG